MSMIPPQVSPTLNAVSSLTPYRCNTGVPDLTASSASSYTAPSTHPPDTLPTTSPAGDTAIAAPGSRGALLNVATTVASPKVCPAAHHLTIWSRMSRTNVSLRRRGGRTHRADSLESHWHRRSHAPRDPGCPQR